jgi:hypothetical protein
MSVQGKCAREGRVPETRRPYFASLHKPFDLCSRERGEGGEKERNRATEIKKKEIEYFTRRFHADFAARGSRGPWLSIFRDALNSFIFTSALLSTPPSAHSP